MVIEKILHWFQQSAPFTAVLVQYEFRVVDDANNNELMASILKNETIANAELQTIAEARQATTWDETDICTALGCTLPETP